VRKECAKGGKWADLLSPLEEALDSGIHIISLWKALSSVKKLSARK
jgi:hypothetical protein